MKIDFKKLANGAIKIAGPIVVAAITHKLLTGKLDIKAAAIEAAKQAIADRAGA